MTSLKRIVGSRFLPSVTTLSQTPNLLARFSACPQVKFLIFSCLRQGEEKSISNFCWCLFPTGNHADFTELTSIKISVVYMFTYEG